MDNQVLYTYHTNVRHNSAADHLLGGTRTGDSETGGQRCYFRASGGGNCVRSSSCIGRDVHTGGQVRNICHGDIHHGDVRSEVYRSNTTGEVRTVPSN